MPDDTTPAPTAEEKEADHLPADGDVIQPGDDVAPGDLPAEHV